VPGFTAETLYLPNEDVYIVILTNTEFSAIPITALSRILGGLAIGKPYIFKDLPIAGSALKKYVGRYENNMGEQLNITERNGSLVFQRPNGAQYKLGYAGGDEFFLDVNLMRINFVAGSDRKIYSLKFSKVDVGATEWFKTGKALLPLAPGRIADSLLQQYEGNYLFPGEDTITIIRDGPNLYLKKGREEFLLAATDHHRFFAVKNDLKVEFTNGSANVAGLKVTQDEKDQKYIKLQ
jgi:hypothetical protein